MIESLTKKAIKKNRNRLQIISNERIRDELLKMAEISLYNAIILLDKTNLLEIILPEIHALKEVRQDGDIRNIHLEGKTVFEHTLLVLENVEKRTNDIITKFAALFHDVGKTKTRLINDGKIQFIDHEKVGAEMTFNILMRMKFPKDFAKKVSKMVKLHLKPRNLTNIKTIKRFFREEIDMDWKGVFNLAIADAEGTFIKYQNNKIGPDKLEMELLEKIKNDIKLVESKIKEENDLKFLMKARRKIINGNDVMEEFGLKPGPEVGKIMQIVDEIFDEFGEKLTKEFILEKVKERL